MGAQAWELRGRRRRLMKKSYSNLAKEVRKEMKSQEGVVWEEGDELRDRQCFQGERKVSRKQGGWGMHQEVLRGIH